MYLQPMIPPNKRFDIFPPCGGCSESLDAFRFLFKQRTLNSPEVVLIMMPEDRSARRFRSTRMVDRGGGGYLSTGGDACWWKLCKVSVVVMPCGGVKL